MDWRGPIVAILVILAGFLMYYPFFKMYERSILKKESERQDEQQKYAVLDLDF